MKNKIDSNSIRLNSVDLDEVISILLFNCNMGTQTMLDQLLPQGLSYRLTAVIAERDNAPKCEPLVTHINVIIVTAANGCYIKGHESENDVVLY